MDGRGSIAASLFHATASKCDAHNAPKKADMNCDGAVDFSDIDPFVEALADPDQYKHDFPSCDLTTGDVNGDGFVNFDDIDPFVVCLVDGGCP